MQVGQGTSFTQIYNQFKPGPLGNADQHLRLTGTNLHTHNPLMPHGKGAAALQARLEKYDNAAVAVKNAIAQEYGPAVADRVFRNLGLGSEVRLRDLRAIKAEIERLPVLDIETYRREGAGIDRGEMLSAAVEGRDPALEDALDAFSQKTQTSDSLQFLRAVHDYRQNRPRRRPRRSSATSSRSAIRSVSPTGPGPARTCFPRPAPPCGRTAPIRMPSTGSTSAPSPRRATT